MGTMKKDHEKSRHRAGFFSFATSASEYAVPGQYDDRFTPPTPTAP